MFALTAYAAETAANAPAPDMGNMIWTQVMMIFVIFSIFYFLLIRPQQKQKRQLEQKINALKKGDRVVFGGGIYGSIIGIKDYIAVVKIAENVKIEVQKSSIAAVVEEEEKKE